MMKKFTIYKDKILKAYNKLNSFDVKLVFERLNSINLEDIKKIDSKNIVQFIKTSKYTKSIISLFFFTTFTFFVLGPNIKSFYSKFKLSRQYQKELKILPSINEDLLNKKKKFKKISFAMQEIENSIIKKENLIFISNLFNDLSKSTSVRLDLIKPISELKESSFCKISEINQLSKNKKALINKNKKISSNQAIYELKIYGNYLNIVTFINYLQNYDVIIIANCLQVKNIKTDEVNDLGSVKANLLLKIPLR